MVFVNKKYFLSVAGCFLFGGYAYATAPNIQTAFIASTTASNTALVLDFHSNGLPSGTADLQQVDIEFHPGVATSGAGCTGAKLG